MHGLPAIDRVLLLLTVAAAWAAQVARPARAGEGIEVRVDCSLPAGTVRALHGVNNGPLNFGEVVDLSAYYRQAGFPLVRLHDSEWPCGNVVDMHAVFPDPRADPNRAESFRFARTDDYIAPIIAAGAGIVYRLGESIETTRRKHHVAPPPDYDRWAAACVGIIRHYNEGWAGGHRYSIRYWEIWNEPENRPNMWTGSDEDYYRLYATAAKAIKSRFPKLKVGGPSVGATGELIAGELRPTKFITGFLDHCRKHAAPLDFFSWHTYSDDPSVFARKARGFRKLLDDRGFADAENHLNEWNYLPDNDWTPNGLAGQGLPRQRWLARMGGAPGAAFLACALMDLQDAPLDAANYYSGETNLFGLFDRSGVPKKTYHAMRAFRMLLDTPARVQTTGGRTGQLGVCAALGRDRAALTVLVASFRNQRTDLDLRIDNVPWAGKVRWEVLRLDADSDLRPAGAGSSAARPVRLKLPCQAPCVLVVRLAAPPP